MMKRVRNNDERGQSMVIIALAFVGLIAFLALVIDGGMIFAARRQMQNAADAAALAGVRKLFALYEGSHSTADEEDILKAVHAYAEANGVEDTDPGNPLINDNVTAYFVDATHTPIGQPLPDNDSIPADAIGVEVTTTTSFDSFFATVIGQDQLGASAVAASILVEEHCGGPYAIWVDSYDCGSNALDCTGSDITLIGSVHSNDGVHIAGSASNPATIDGAVECCGDLNLSNVTYDSLSPWPLEEWCDPTKTYPKPWNGLNIVVSRFQPEGDLASAAADDPDPACQGEIGGVPQASCYHYFPGNFPNLSQDETLLDGLYFVDGNVTVKANDMPDGTVNITIVATGAIKMVNIDQNTFVAYSDLDGEGPPDLVLFSNKNAPNGQCSPWVIDISSSATTWTGIIFAPYGKIDISGSNTAILGAVWGYTVNLSGAYQSVGWSADFCEYVISPSVFLIR